MIYFAKAGQNRPLLFHIDTILPIYISSLLNDDSAAIILILGTGEWIPQNSLHSVIAQGTFPDAFLNSLPFNPINHRIYYQNFKIKNLKFIKTIV